MFGEELAGVRRFYRWAGGKKQRKTREPARRGREAPTFVGDVALAIGRQQAVMLVIHKGYEEASYIRKDQLPYL